MARFEDAIGTVLAHEGGFSDDPVDPGGATNYGVSLRFLRDAGIDLNQDGVIDERDVRSMTVEQAVAVYRSEWWEPLQLGAIAVQVVATKIFDAAVNMGSGTVVRMVQQCLSRLGVMLAVDGRMGPQTLGALNHVDHEWFLTEFRAALAARYRYLIEQHPQLARFRLGWMRRAYA